MIFTQFIILKRSAYVLVIIFKKGIIYDIK